MSFLDVLTGDWGATRPANIAWPNGAAIAVSLTVALEGFETSSQYRRRSAEVDYVSVAYGEFGGRSGIWRLKEIMERYGMRGTIDLNGLAAERHPRAVESLHASGHEIVGHGWRNDDYLDTMEPETERQVIRRTLDTIQRITGRRPVGWVSPGHRLTEHTLSFLAEEGVVWTGDVPSDDLPYHIDVDGHRMVVVPRVDCANDHNLLMVGHNPPPVYVEAFRAAFDQLYAEGLAGRPRAMDFFVHAHIGGRPHIAGAVEACLRYARGFSRVWFCSKGDIAAWYLEQLDSGAGHGAAAAGTSSGRTE